MNGSYIGARPLKAVCLGGGHGLHATLEAMRLIASDVTAVVCVGDDGGSSGRLREEFPGVLPPGDIRKALCALASEQSRRRGVPELLEHRFASHEGGDVNGHSLGNLILLSQWQRSGDVLEGIRAMQKIFDIDGTILPGAAVPLDLSADVETETGKRAVVRSQRRIAKTRNKILQLHISPENPPVYPEVIHAIETADIVTLGPGSWYSSLLVHLLVPQIREALHHTLAKTVLIMNLGADRETTGLDPHGQIATYLAYSRQVEPDVVIADPTIDADSLDLPARTQLYQAPLGRSDAPEVHDIIKLAAALQNTVDMCVR